jgi:alcohol dehydrogenase class IV
MTLFEFTSPTRVWFGEGVIGTAHKIIENHGRRVLIVASAGTFRRTLAIEQITHELQLSGCSVVVFDEVTPEPDAKLVHRGVNASRSARCDVILAVGGGSSIDVAKAIAVASTHEAWIDDYVLPSWGGTRSITSTTLPLIAVPTTAGTGSEVTNSAVIRNGKTGHKQVLVSDFLFPKAAIIDPELFLSLPSQVTLGTAMDSLTQSIEAHICKFTHPFAQAAAYKGIQLVVKNLPIALRKPNDIAARTQLALAATLSGIAIAKSGVGAVHGLAMGLGSFSDVPHGISCAIFLPHVMRANAEVDHKIYTALCPAIVPSYKGDASSQTMAAVQAVVELQAEVGFKSRLQDFGISNDDVETLTKLSQNPDMSGNPVMLTQQQILEIINAAL